MDIKLSISPPAFSKLQIAQLEYSREFGSDERFYSPVDSHLFKIEV